MGIYILKKIAHSDSPSIRAASIMSTGKLREFCLNIIIINGVEIAGSIKPATVLIKPSLDIIVKRGISVATAGTIIAISRTVNSLSFALS